MQPSAVHAAGLLKDCLKDEMPLQKVHQQMHHKLRCSGGVKPRPCQYLVGEGARHDEGRVAGGTAQVEQTTLSQDNDSVAVGVDEAVHLRLDVLPLHSCTEAGLTLSTSATPPRSLEVHGVQYLTVHILLQSEKLA